MSWTQIPSSDVNLCMLVRGGRPSSCPILEQKGEGLEEMAVCSFAALQCYGSTGLQDETKRLNQNSL